MMVKFKRLSYSVLLIAPLLAICPTASGAGKNSQASLDRLIAVLSTEHCAVGCPSGGSDVTVWRDAYVLNNNAHTKFANWVAYKITKDSSASGRRRSWRKDPDIPASDTLSPLDYEGANAALNVQRGHQAGLAAMSGVPDWEALNYLSNITPQRDVLNMGAWARLEDRERELGKAADVDGVHVLTGPLYERYIGVLPQASKAHIIPSGYWKLISVGSTPENGMYASFVLDQDSPRQANFCDYQVTVSDIEKRSGLTIWTDLPAEVQAVLKSTQGQLLKRIGCE